MAEEMNENTPGAIPPKVSPLSPAKPGAPRPITIRRPALTPAGAGATPAAPAAAPAAPAAAAAEPEAPAAAPTPVVRPSTIHLKPVTAAASAPEAGADAAAPAGPTPVVRPSTIHLKPVTPAAPMPAEAAQPQSPPTPGANPLPPGPKPPSSAQVQAAKSKTSRISLDSAIGVAPVSDPVGPKTIRLKRPADLSAAPTVVNKPVPKAATAPIHQTAPIPESAAPAAPTITQKRTLKIKRPGAETPPPAEAAAESNDAAFQNLAPIESLDLGEKGESKAFTVIAVICASLAAVAVILLTLCVGAHTLGPSASRNDEATISGPELPWIGRIAQ